MKFIKQLLKNTILRLDMFAASPTFRFNGQSSYETYFGGCLSFLLVALFALIFSTNFKDTINKVNITATTNMNDNPYDTTDITDIKFAVGIQGLDFSKTQRYFNIILRKNKSFLNGSSVTQSIQLSPCNAQDWTGKGTNFTNLYSIYGMDKMLCASSSQNLTLSGFAGTEEWVKMYLTVQQCKDNGNTSWTCHSNAEISNLFSNQLELNDFFKVNFLVLNTVISPQQEIPTVSVLQNQIFITFSNTSGSRCQLKLGRYQITTDNSIWPTSSDTTSQGYYITSHDTYSINLYSTHYVRIQIEKARTIYEISRQYDKLDDTFSYVGGLFSILFSFIFFFMGSYNEYKYEIAVAENAFSLDQTGNKLRQDHFNVFTYLQYSLYDWFKTFGINLCWKKMEQIDQARQEATQQMDMRLFIKKIQKLEIFSKMLIGQYNMICGNLTQPLTIQQVKRMRLINNYYDEVTKISTSQNQNKNQNKQQNDKNINMNMTEQIKIQKKQKQIQQQLQYQYQQIQKQIAQIYKQNSNNIVKNQIASKIYSEIPQHLKFRLLNVKNLQKQQLQLVKSQKQKEKQLSQSSFNMSKIVANSQLPPIIVKKVPMTI